VTGINPPGRLGLLTLLNELQQKVEALARQQNFVITDPTRTEGDPANGHAVIVIGNLKPITGLPGFGLASFHTGSWVRIA
jgi:hypothetical protein